MSRRSGFTLVELLVVITIIAILVGITYAVLGDSLQSARIKATQATIEQIDQAVNQVSSSVYERNIRGLAQQFKAGYDVRIMNVPINPPPNDTLPIEVAEYVVRRDMLRGTLPQRLEDTWGLDGTPGTIDDSGLWSRWKSLTLSTDATPRPVGHRHDLENIELLVLALTQSGASLDRIESRFRRDDNGNGIVEIYDDWGQPLRFYTWGTRLIRPGGNGEDIDSTLFYNIVAPMFPAIPPMPSGATTLTFDTYGHPLNQDPFDFTGSFSAGYLSTGLLASNYNWMTPSGVASYPAFDETSFFTIDTYHQHIIVSGGPDEETGLVDPNGFDPLTQTDRQTQSNPTSPLRNAEPLAYRDASRYDDVYDNVTNGVIR